MNSSDLSRENPERPLVVDSSDISNPIGNVSKLVEKGTFDGNLLAEYRPSLLIGAALIISGIFHLTLLWITGADWSGPLSLRKPALFGVSAGVTVWSIVWVLRHFERRRYDQIMANSMSFGLLLEVGLITLQKWRGVPSHFHRATAFDATIESMMLVLILLVTAGIAWLCWRSRHLQPMHGSDVIAIRGGMLLLLVSCGLGLIVTIAGELNLAKGQPPEIWGRAGVLKYPHGAALHAIQTLPLLSALMRWLGVAHSAGLLRAALAAHIMFLIHALWQTINGRTRMDVDGIGGITLVMAAVLISLPLVTIFFRVILTGRDYWFGPVSALRSN